MSDATRAFPDAVSALPAGTRLAEFEIKSLLGVGGFGIVYLAFDHQLEREVAVKEYMPASMAGRTETLHVTIRSQSDAEVFALGLRSFVNEGKLLARFDHPSLIKVYRFWEGNGTAYMAMPVLRGHTLKHIRKSSGRGPDEAWLRAVLTPLLGALEHLHNEGVYHRDIAPDNIHLEAEGRPVLLDFGAARRVISGKTQMLTAILKPAYAPIEQYGESGAVKQGPWTDLYALGATLHYMLLGHPPPPATVRTVADDSTALAAQAIPGVSPQTLAVIDWMLAPRPNERPQNVAELREALDGRRVVPPRANTTAPTPQWDKTVISAQSSVTIPLGETAQHTDLDLDMTAAPAPVAAPARGARAPTRAQPQAIVQQHAAEPAMAADDMHRLHPPASRTRLLPLALAGVVLAAVAGYFGWARFEAGQGGGTANATAPTAAAAAVAATVSPGASSALTAQAPLATTPVAGTSPVATAPAAIAASTTVVTAASAPAMSEAAAGAAPAGVAAPTGAAAVAAAAIGTSLGAASAAAATPATAAAPSSTSARPTRTATPPPGATGGPGNAAHAAGGTGARPGIAGASAERHGSAGAAGQSGTTATPSNPTGASPAAQGAMNASPSNAATPLVPAGPATAGGAGAAGRATAAGAASASAEPSPGATPEARCIGRNPLMHFVCMGRECTRQRFTNHPECVAWRQRSRPEGVNN